MSFPNPFWTYQKESDEICFEFKNKLDEIWNINFEKLKYFINKEKRKPKSEKKLNNLVCKNIQSYKIKQHGFNKYKKLKEKEEIKLSAWFTNCKRNYKMKTDVFKDNIERCKQWEEFLEEYKEYLKRSRVTIQLLKIE